MIYMFLWSLKLDSWTQILVLSPTDDGLNCKICFLHLKSENKGSTHIAKIALRIKREISSTSLGSWLMVVNTLMSVSHSSHGSSKTVQK